MKSNDKKVSISIRKLKNNEVIVLRKLPIGKDDVKVSTGKQPTKENLEFYRVNGWIEFQKLTTKENKIFFRALVKEALLVIDASVRASTSQDRESKVNQYLLPYFGSMQLEEITAKRIEQWQIEMIRAKGENLTRRCKNLLHRILDRAVVYGYMTANPITVTATIKNREKSKREIYSKEEIALMLRAANGWLKVFILVRVYLGLRSNEMVGLKWEDIDFDKHKVHVRRGIRFGTIAPPKTGARTIDLPSAPAIELQKLKAQSHSEWVFVSSRNDYWGDCGYINRRHFQPFLESIGVEYKSFYSLRHSYTTYSIIGGQPLPYVSKQLGHRDSRTTLQSYLKYSDDIGGREKTDEIFKFD